MTKTAETTKTVAEQLRGHHLGEWVAEPHGPGFGAYAGRSAKFTDYSRNGSAVFNIGGDEVFVPLTATRFSFDGWYRRPEAT